MAQNENANVRPAAAMTRIALTSLAVAVAVTVVGYWPTSSLAGAAGVNAMLIGVGISLIGAWAGSAPTVAYLRKEPREHANGILMGLSVRFAVTIGLALAAYLVGDIARKPLLLWVGISQLVILLVDVLGLVSLLKTAARDS